MEAIARRKPGEQVTLTIYRTRGGNEREVKVTLGEHPDQAGKAYLGVTIGGSFRFFGLPGSEGGFLPPGLEFGQGHFFQMPMDELPFHLDQLPLDQLPFHLDEMPGGGQEFHREFEFQLEPGGEDSSL